MIAIAISVAHPAAVDPAPAAIVEDADPCDFSGDGRLARPRAAARNAWTAPDFYLALAIGAVLAIAVLVIRVPAVHGDWRGDLEAAGSLAAAGGTTFVLKELIHERRPDRSDDRSFPSGHTSISFAAATTLEKRYGWQAGLPTLAVASFVGLARVQADKHYVHDVLAGAVIGGVSGLLITGRHDDRVQLSPWSTHGGGGLDLTLQF